MEKPRLTKIGQVAKASGVSIDTIRYYEKQGLIQKAPRSEGNFRLYGQEVIARLLFIKKGQQFGFTLAEIRKIMSQSSKGLQPCCAYVGKLLNEKLVELEEQMAELRCTKRSLKGLMKSWIPPEEAIKQDYVVCPQIERAQTQGGKKNGKKKH